MEEISCSSQILSGFASFIGLLSITEVIFIVGAEVIGTTLIINSCDSEIIELLSGIIVLPLEIFTFKDVRGFSCTFADEISFKFTETVFVEVSETAGSELEMAETTLFS